MAPATGSPEGQTLPHYDITKSEAAHPQTKLPSVSEGIVDDSPLPNNNYITKNRVFTRIGSNGVLEPIPSIVHYGGFQLRKVHKQTIRICNVAGYSSRCHVVPPTTPFFKVAAATRRGFIAPGLSEEITLEFCPTEHRYYYDCIRIHSEEENLLVPIHAYPVMNEIKFPSRVDFGSCQVGELHVKEIHISCKVPIDFEYEIVVLKDSHQFHVSDMKGVVPANGTSIVTVQYQPSQLATAAMEVELRVAEFGSKPVVCSITGNAKPGAARQREISTLTGSQQLQTEELYGTKPVGQRAFGTETGMGGGDGRGGAGGGDAYTRTMTEMRRRRKIADGTWGQISTNIQPLTTTMMQPPPLEEVMVDGVYVPQNLETVKAVSYVLNQQPGKLRIQDIQTMIDEKNREAALREGRLGDALSMTNTQGSSLVLDPLDDMSLPDDVKEGMFLMQIQEHEIHARRMEMGFTMQAIGDDLLSANHCAAVHQARLDHHLLFNHAAKQDHAHRIAPILESGSLQMINASTDPELDPVSSSNRWDADRLGGEVEALEGLEDQEPSWNPYSNDTWMKRAQTLDQLVRAGRIVIIRNRVQKRLNQIKGLLKGCNYNRSEVAALVVSEMLSAKDKAVERPGIPPNQMFNLQKVCPAPVPVYRKNLFKHRSPVERNYIAEFDLVDMLSAKVPLKFKLLGYEEAAWSAVPSYLPLLDDQPLLAGAEEESSSAAVPTAAVPTPECFPTMPDCFTESPFESFAVAARYTETCFKAATVPSWGTVEEERVQPVVYVHEDTAYTHDPASNSCRSLRTIPMLSNLWTPRKELWQVMGVIPPDALYGPHPDDKLHEDADDQMRPKAQPHAPSQSEMDMLLSIDTQPAQPEQAAAAPVEDKGGKPGKAKPEKSGKGATDGGKGSKPTTPSDDNSRGVTPSTPAKGVRMEQDVWTKGDIARREFESEVNTALLDRRRKLVQEMQSRVDEYNSMLRLPCHFKLTF